ncbi:MAG TPA: hypothetical protein VGX68_10125 [Thermoanaerobaculia bacterium]|nr:hypothetical protein [Thermoanaerobaculia bacterium]
MSAFSFHSSRPKTKLWLVLAMLLLCQLAVTAEFHHGHSLEPAIQAPSELIFSEACHPREVSHLEATGKGHLSHPCALCLHLVRSAGAHGSSVPRLAAPVRLQLPNAAFASRPSSGTSCECDSRAPPLA